MKNKLLVIMIAVAVLLSVGVNSFAQDVTTNATANDHVGCIYTPEGSLLSLGMEANDGVSLTFADTSYAVTAPGLATITSGGTAVTADGGRLVYTVRNATLTKITAEAEAANNVGYVNDSLGVRATSIGTGGSAHLSAEHGAVVGILTFYSLNSTAAVDIITNIDAGAAADVYTGKGALDGAPVQYELTENAGIATVNVTYTIIAQ